MRRPAIRIATHSRQVTQGEPAEHSILCPVIGRYPRTPENIGTWLSPLAAHGANDALLQGLAEADLREVSPRVYAGVFAADPLRTEDALIRQLKAAGVSAVVNFPSVSFIDGKAGATLDQLGLGIDREI